MLSVNDFKEKHVVLCFAREGQKMSFRNDNLLVLSNQGEVLLQVTCYKIFSVWIIGNSAVTSVLLEKSRKFGFSVVLLSYTLKVYGVWQSGAEGNYLLREKQYAYNGNALAKLLVGNKIANQIALLKNLPAQTPGLQRSLQSLQQYQQGLAGQPLEHAQILGMEGIAARVFFEAWYGHTGWAGRKPRTKVCPINTTLDIGYTYLFNFMESLLTLYGFDVYRGVYHRAFYQRKSLVCDLVEPFRCIIDRKVRAAHNLKQLQASHFQQIQGRYLLLPEHNKTYTRWLLESILERKTELFQYVQHYYRCFMRCRSVESYPQFLIEKS